MLTTKKEKKERKQIILNCEELETRSAYLVNGRLEGYELERTCDDIVAGSVYFGKIVRHEPSLQAAFVDIGCDKNAFLHYHDMLPASYDMMDNIKKIEEEEEIVRTEEKSSKRKAKKLLNFVTEKLRNFMGKTNKSLRLKELEEKIHSGKINVKDIPKVFPVGSEILVQVSKGPIGTKGARVTTNISLAGRYLVLLPYAKARCLSSKIENKTERTRLRKILTKLPVPDNMGIICRTVGEGRKALFFERDLTMLLEIWSKVEEQLPAIKSGQLVLHEPSLLERTVRDTLTDEIDEIIVDDKEKYAFLQASLKKFVGDDFETKVKFYKQPASVFSHYGVAEQVATLFNRVVNLPSGGYICIDETEALIAIDINTGKSRGDMKQSELILQTNTEAAEEIARQLRLRDIGGQVVIDFIDMDSAADREKINKRMKDLMKKDRSKTFVLPLSRFGLMELTRQREHESVKDAVYDLCPYCNGSGHVKSAISMSVEIQRKLKETLRTKRRSKNGVRVYMNPTILARLKNSDAALLVELEKEYGKDLQFRADPTIHIEEFRLVDPVTEKTLD